MSVAKSANVDVVMDFHGPDKVLSLAYTAAIKSATGYSARRLEAPTVLGTTLGANGRQLSYTAPVVGCELGCGYRPAIAGRNSVSRVMSNGIKLFRAAPWHFLGRGDLLLSAVDAPG